MGGHRRIRKGSLAKFAQAGGPPVKNPAALERKAGGESGTPRYDAKAFLRVLLDDDGAAVARMVVKLRERGASFDCIADRLVQPALTALGHRWEQGRVEIFEERRACELVQQALRTARAPVATDSGPLPLAIGGSLSGDPYSLPSVLAECVLGEWGFDARSLGSELPAASIAKAIQAKRPALVWLCLNVEGERDEFDRSCAVIQRACDKTRAVLAVGGRALGLRGKAAMPRAISCRSMGDLAAVAGIVLRAI